jgi:predicted  nucleic acid-binding Zn-ribbon protein
METMNSDAPSRAERIATLRAEREALNLDIRARREKLRDLSEQILALEYEERHERLMAKVRRPPPRETRMKVEPGKMKFKPKR